MIPTETQICIVDENSIKPMEVRMKAKKFFSILLCMLMMFPLVPATSYAATGSDFTVTGGSGYTYSAGGTLTFTSPGDYTVTMTSAGAVTTTDRIAVNGGTAAAPINITLNGVSIDHPACAFELQGTSVVNLTLAGDNNLTSGLHFCGGSSACRHGADD